MSVIWMDVDAALAEVPVNLLALTDDTDFKSRETGIVYNQAGMDLVWNFVTTAGATSQIAVTPTTAGDYDWAHQGDGMYTIEITASGGASINNDTEGFGYFTGICTGVLHWRGPTIGFRDAALNNLMIDDAFSATRGLAGTALPAAAADAAGGLAISDAGGLDLDAMNTNINDIEIDTGITIPAILGTPVDTDIATDIANVPDAVHEESLEDHVTEGTAGYAQMLSVYAGPHGPGIYIDSDAANTNTVKGTDGTESNPVSTFAAARTLADGIGTDTYYFETGTDLTLGATHTNWRFFGLGSPSDTLINLGSQDVGMSKFDHVSLEGTQGGSDRIFAEDCVLRDPGPGSTTLHILGLRCGIFDDITLDTSNDNVLIDSYSLVAGGGAPIVRASGASGTLIMNGHKGGVDLRDLSASHNLTVNIAGGQVIFDASCNVNANVELRGIGIKTDNTAGMADLNEVAFINVVATATAVWDRIISKANHDIGQSAGKILRQSGDLVQIDGAISDVSPATTGFDTNLTQADDYFDDAVMIFSNGSANVGIGLPVSTYLNANGAMTFDAPDDWPVTPVNGDDFVIYATHVHPVGQIADAVLDEALSGHTTAGSLGKAVADIEVDTGTTIPAILGTPVDTDMSTDTANVQAAVDAVDALIQALNDLSAADVNAEVLDVIAVDTFGESSGVPSATDTLERKIAWVTAIARNKLEQNATTLAVRNDGDSADIAAAPVSDDGTDAIRGEFV